MIVLGFVIGAGLSLFGKAPPAIVSVAESPSAAATIAQPSALADTPKPLPSPSPRPASPQARRSPIPPRTEPSAPAHLATPDASPAASAAAAPAPADSNSTTEATAAGTPTATAATSATTPVPARPTHSAGAAEPARVALGTSGGPSTASAREPVASPAPLTATAPVATPLASQQSAVVVSGSTTPFARLAASVVRVYLSAVARGDHDSAAAELAAPPAGALVEEGVVDGATQVRAVEVHGTGDIVTVNVDLKTAAGPYSAQFTVEKSPTGAALIAEHSIIKS